MSANRILLVDDSRDDVSIFTQAFNAAHFKTPLQTVSGGEEAIAYLKGEGRFGDRVTYPLPSLVLLDLKMSDTDGFDFIRWLKSQPRLRRIPIIVLSGMTLSSDLERAFDEGAASYLVKPDSRAGMIAMLCCLRDWLDYNYFPAVQDEKA